MEAEVEWLPQTVQLADIDGIEIRESGGSFGYAMVGAALGLAAGAMLALSHTSDPDVAAEPYGAMAILSAVGAVVGLIVGETRYEWKAIYERRRSSGL